MNNSFHLVFQNASVGSLVFRALATDPDDTNTLEGTIHYSFLEESKDSSTFSIDAETGLITTKAILDREIQDAYTLVLVARDMGDVPQQSTKVFTVIVTDIDDNKPVFNRSIVSIPDSGHFPTSGRCFFSCNLFNAALRKSRRKSR